MSYLSIYFRRINHLAVKNHLHSSPGVQESRVGHTLYFTIPTMLYDLYNLNKHPVYKIFQLLYLYFSFRKLEKKILECSTKWKTSKNLFFQCMKTMNLTTERAWSVPFKVYEKQSLCKAMIPSIQKHHSFFLHILVHSSHTLHQFNVPVNVVNKG